MGHVNKFKHLFHFFSLNEFTSLRSLTLTEVDKNNFDKLKVILSLLPKSCSIHLIDPDDQLKEEIRVKRLHGVPISLETLKCHLPLIFEISSITNLMFSCGTCIDISHLFEYLSILKYLDVTNGSNIAIIARFI
jgi:hypothetical protein